MKTHEFDTLSFLAGLVTATIGLIFLIPAEPGDIFDLLAGAGSWFLGGVLVTIGIAVLAPLFSRKRDDAEPSAE